MPFAIFSIPGLIGKIGVIALREKKEEREVDIMSTIKPIQATPELSGKDAKILLDQTNHMPTEEMIKKNKMLHNVLKNIRKA